MRKHTTVDLDQDLIREAAGILGTTKTIDTIHAALSDVVRRRRRQSLLDLPNDLDLPTLTRIRADRFEDRDRRR